MKNLFWALALFIPALSWAQVQSEVTVYGSCGMCSDRIEEIASKFDAINKQKYDITSHTLVVDHTWEFDLMLLHEALASAGHDTDKIKATAEAYNNLPMCCEYRTHTDEVHSHDLPGEESEEEFNPEPIITGHIYEQDDQGKNLPLIGVTIRWLGATDGAVTDVNGFFEIGRIQATDQLIMSYVGFNNDTLNVSKINTLDWTMSDGVRLDDVEVVYRKKSTSISFINPIQVAEMDENELCKAACCSLSESFETNPAIDASFTDAITGARQIQMLGLAGKYVQITSELIPIVRSTTVLDGLDFIPGQWIQSIQLSKGAGSVAQGHESMTGQINVELRKPETKENFFMNVYGNQGGRYEANLIGKYKLNKKVSTALLLHGKTQQMRHDVNDDGFLDMPLGQNYYVQNRWKYQNPNGWQSSLSVKYVNQEGISGQTQFNPEFEDQDQVWGFTKNTESFHSWIKLGRYINPLTESSFGVQVSFKQHDDYRAYGRRPLDVQEQGVFVNALYEQNLSGPNHRLKTGASFVQDDYSESFDIWSFDQLERTVGAFAEYTYKWHGHLTVVLGQRVDHHNSVGLMYAPRLHARYALNEDMVFRLVAGKGWRTARVFSENAGLLANNRNWSIITSDADLPYGLNPEINYNLGANWTQKFTTLNREGVLTLDYYYTIFENQIVPDFESSSTGDIIIRNQDELTVAHSMQVQLDYELIKNLDMRLAYRYNINKAEYGGEEKTVPFNPFHRSFINLEYNHKDTWYFDVTVQWNGSQRLPDTEWMAESNRIDSETEDFFLVMAQVRTFLKKNFELYVGVENALDYRLDNPIVSAQDPWSSDFDASLIWAPIFGRNIYAGLRYRFD